MTMQELKQFKDNLLTARFEFLPWGYPDFTNTFNEFKNNFSEAV